ncbi:MAG: hypothetical protein AAGA81_11910 [Acidobacteriota bacterium]
MSNTGVCALCKRTRDLKRSHIVPEFVYGPIYDDGHSAVGVLATPRGPRSRPVQQGVWERLLCEDCEIALNRWETPSARLWRFLRGEGPDDHYQARAIQSPGGNTAVEVSGVDYPSFKLFLMSLLYRMAVSARPEYQKVHLDDEPLKRLRNGLLAGEPGTQAFFPTTVLGLRQAAESGIILSPMSHQEGDVPVVRLVLTNVMLWLAGSPDASDLSFTQFAPHPSGRFVVPAVRPGDMRLFREAIPNLLDGL